MRMRGGVRAACARAHADLHHGVFQVLRRRGVQAGGAGASYKAPAPKLASSPGIAIVTTWRAKPAEGGQKAHGILGPQHAADQIKRPLDVLFQIRHGARDGRRAMRIVPAVQPDFGIFRRLFHQRTGCRRCNRAGHSTVRRPFSIAPSVAPSPPACASAGDGDARHSRSDGARSAAAAADPADPSRPHRPCGHVPGAPKKSWPNTKTGAPSASARRKMTSRGSRPAARHQRHAGLDDAGFLGGDGGQSCAQEFRDDPGRPAG